MKIENAPLIEHVDFDRWMDKFVNFFNLRDRYFYSPSSITVVAGTATGTVSDVQTAFDGNALQIAEVAATPGFDIEFNFDNVDRQADTILMRLYYEGSATHYIGIEAWNYTHATPAYDRFTFFSDHVTATYEWYQITIPNFNNYRDFVTDHNQVYLRLNHFSGGVSSHDIYIDYVALMV